MKHISLSFLTILKISENLMTNYGTICIIFFRGGFGGGTPYRALRPDKALQGRTRPSKAGQGPPRLDKAGQGPQMFLSCFATCLWFFSFGLPSLPAWPPNRSKPERGAKLITKFTTVADFRTPESPEPKRGANLKLEFETVTHFYQSADPLSGRACEAKP